MRYWIFAFALLVAGPAHAVIGDVRPFASPCCSNSPIDLGTLDFRFPPTEVWFNMASEVTDPFVYCAMDYSAVYDSTVWMPLSLTPERSPVGQVDENIGCMLVPASPTAAVPTANTRIECFIEDQTPSMGPSPVIDNFQGELRVLFGVPVGAPEFTGPVMAYDFVEKSEWNGSFCAPTVPPTIDMDPFEQSVTTITVPEPGTYLGMAAGLGTLALLRRRKSS